VWRVRLGLAAALASTLPAAAERLAIRSYGVADGLAHDHVLCIVPDPRGFLWLCTAQGLSRFDGRRFVNYGAAHGLGELYVNDFVVTRRGEYWLASNGGGVYRLDAASARFEAHPVGDSTAANRVNELFEDEDGRLWAGTDDGLFRARPGSASFERVELPAGPPPRVQGRAFAQDGERAVWAATSAGLFRSERGGPFARVASLAQSFFSVLADRRGRIWAGHEQGLVAFERGQPGRSALGVPERARRASDAARVLHQHSDGRLFLGGRDGSGLAEWDGERLRHYTTANGLSDNVVTALAEDASGNLWIGTETGGVMRLAKGGFVSFDTGDGLGHRRVVSVFETRNGELLVLTAMRYVNRFDGRSFTAVRPRLVVAPSIQSAHSMMQDRAGGWWAATPKGLARYPPRDGVDALARAEADALYTRKDGLADDDAGRPFEDARGDVWVTGGGAAPALTRWERATGTFHRYGEADGLPAGNAPVAFGEDRAGTLWIGFREGGLARRSGERFEFFGAAAGVPAAMARSLHRDGRGRLWAATTGGGLLRVVDSEGGPRFERYSTENGLSSDHIRCLTDDGQGRLYLGTAVGVDRFDPDRGAVAHFTTADGLAQNEIQAAYRDRSGALWFGTMGGVSRLQPSIESVEPPSAVLIGALAVGGVARPLSALGERALSEFAVDAGNSLRIEYFASDFAPGSRGLFQHRLAGADSSWSPPAPQDSVEYAALAPGRYRFEVRAHGHEGPDAPAPASVAFVVEAPVWRRAWFLALAAGALGLLAFQFHRSRVRRALELERVRTRIATDLHDDIGSGLSQIAIWSEVAARDSREPTVRETLDGIAAACREAVDSMSDIVWAVNPAHDRLGDLSQRMRRFASDAFTARDVAFRFEASLPDGLALGSDLRRHVLLVFKEAVHNAVRHSGCAAAEASVAVADGRLRVVLRDDGKGFDAGERRDGHGLASMAARARELGGTLDVTSVPGAGTTVRLDLPLEVGTSPRH
jgi:ligand-binding sensor domain-containing protein/signal transduction histidine kinase